MFEMGRTRERCQKSPAVGGLALDFAFDDALQNWISQQDPGLQIPSLLPVTSFTSCQMRVYMHYETLMHSKSENVTLKMTF